MSELQVHKAEAFKMEKIVKLLNFSSGMKPHTNNNSCISRNLKYICVISEEKCCKIYGIGRNKESAPCEYLIWQSPVEAISCKFSEDGNQIIILYESGNFQIFQLYSDKVQLVAEKNFHELSTALLKNNISFTKTNTVTPLVIHKENVILLIDNTWIVTLRIYQGEEMLCTNRIELSSCVMVTTCRNSVYALSRGGNVSAYSLEDSRQLGVVNLYSLVPRTYPSEVQVFTSLAVSLDGSFLAVADRASQVFLACVRSHFLPSEQQEDRWDCGTSIRSASSGTSRFSIRTTSSLLRVQAMSADSISLRSYDVLEKERIPSYRSNWNSYLKALKEQSGVSRDRSKEEHSTALRHLSSPPVGHIVQSLNINSAGLSVWYTEDGATTGGVYRQYDLQSGSCLAEAPIPENTIIIGGGFLGLIDAFFSSSSLWLFLGNLSRDLLVNKLLHCVDTEAIGQLLRGAEWGDLAVPLSTLANGLKQQQMDVAHLALGLHGQAFKSAFITSSLDNEDVLIKKKDVVSSNMEKLFNTIHEAIDENPQHATFHEHLVLFSLSHANDLLQFLHENYTTFPCVEIVQSLITSVMSHVVKLRHHLYKRGKSKKVEVKEYHPLNTLKTEMQHIWEKWEALSDTNVVQDAVSCNNIPLAQVFLINCRNWKKIDFHISFQEEVQKWVHIVLTEGDIEKAQQIFINLGRDPNEELGEICLHSLDKNLRDRLAEYLSQQGLLKPKEVEAWSFLKRIEDILECVEFPPTRKFSQVLWSSHKSSTSVDDLPVIAEHFYPLPIATVACQSDDWQHRVLIDLFFNIPGTSLEKELKPDMVWKYLLRHNRDDLLKIWIDCYFHEDTLLDDNETDIEGLLQWNETIRNIAFKPGVPEKKIIDPPQMQKIMKSWTLDQSMIDNVQSAESMQRTKDFILDHLSRYGIFSSLEKQRPNAVLSRILRIRSLPNLKQILEQPTANISYESFMDLLTALVIKNDLYNVPFACLQDFEFSSDQVQALCLPTSSNRRESMHWFQLWLTFRELSKDPNNQELVLETTLKSAQYLSDEDVQKYLQEHPYIVLAMVIFSTHSVTDVFKSEDGCEDLQLTREILDCVLKQLPPLEMALKSFQNQCKQKADVTIYQLLEGYTQFDTSKLFGWQKMHSIAAEEFPHFTSQRMIEMYGSNHTLTYLDYLKQARPNFAVNTFIVNQFKTHRKISKEMIKVACNFAHGLALKYFDDPGIKCSCIAFIEMLGQSSQAVRVNVGAANKILKYLDGKTQNNVESHKSHREKIGKLLFDIVRNDFNGSSELLVLLQEALLLEFTCERDENCEPTRKMVHDLLQWDLAVKFARFHKLKLPEVFLTECAKQDEWLYFVVCVQLYGYPLEQVLQLVSAFHSIALREHLHHAFGSRVSKQVKKKPKLSSRDSRKMLYSKIGLKRGTSPGSGSDPPSPSEELVSTSSGEDIPSPCHTPLICTDVVNPAYRNDLFLTLLKCHGNMDPPRALLAACLNHRNPVLAVLATCYEPSSVLSCFCMWLLTSLPGTVLKHLSTELNSALQQHTWSAADVERLFEETVSNGYVTSLYRGFQLFLRDNPLCIFSEFLFECVRNKNFKDAIMSIKMFKAAYLNLRYNAPLTERDDLEGTFLTNGLWVVCVAVHLIGIVLAKCYHSSYYQLRFLYTLQEAKFMDHLPVEAPNLALLVGLLECLEGTGVSLDMSVMCLQKEEHVHKEELVHCIDQLVQTKHFSPAVNLATLAQLPKDSIIVAQWQNKFENRQLEKKSLEIEFTTFWNDCNEAFKEANIKPSMAGKFFHGVAEIIDDCRERYCVFELALLWFHLAAIDDPSNINKELASVEVKMWTSWLQAEPEIPLISGSTIPRLLRSLKLDIMKSSGISNLKIPVSPGDGQKQIKLNSLIGKLLDQGDVATAFRVEAIFAHRNQDLQILLTCMGLAEGELTPYQLTAEQRLLLSDNPNKLSSSNRRRTLLSSVSSMSHSPLNQSISTDFMESPSKDSHDTMAVLEKLADQMVYGKAVGRRIVACYRVAMNLDKCYQEIISLQDPLSLLKTAIADDCLNKFIVASDLMVAAQSSKEEIADFLCGEIVAAIMRQNSEGEIGSVCMWGCDLDANFHLVLEICDEPSTLGTRLLAAATDCGTSHIEDIQNAVELTIHAHDCYTAACNMEGIAAVLQKARILTNSLQNRQEWALMVRLFTGVGRYTEMNYVFQILQENDLFEFLLRKRFDKVPGLKLAFLEFIKMHCPENRKLFQIAALHFGMSGEVAVLWAQDGKTKIDALLAVAESSQSTDIPTVLSNTEDNKQCLFTAMECFRLAAEFYLQANKLNRAMASAHQAELLALQIALVNSVPIGQGADCLLNLKAQQISRIIINKLSFPEALIVARAYSHPVDWGAVLYQHCIVQRDTGYLSDFTHSMQLTTSLVEDVARRFQMDRNITREMTKEMKKFVECVSSVDVKYRVASQLGYKDIIESLLNGPEVAYLKDTVWQRGFRQ